MLETWGTTINKWSNNTILLFVFWSVLIVLSLFLVPIQDYREYINQWQLVISGENPWMDLGYNKTNTYGPLHSMMALAAQINIFLPRLLSTLAGIFMYYLIRRQNKTQKTTNTLHLHFLWNPFVWITCAIIGHNDAFVGLIVLTAMLAFRKEWHWLAGAFIALGVWYKIYPLIFLPFLAIHDRKINWRVILSFGITSLLILSLTFWIWGNSFFYSFTYNTVRVSKFLSIFRFLRGDLFPFGQALDRFSIFMVLGSQAVLYIWYLIKSPETVKTCIISFLLLLMFYKVGHVQFHFTGIVLLLCFMVAPPLPKISKTLSTAVFLYLYWLTIISVFDHLITVSGHSNYYIREFAGFFNTLIMGNLIFWLLKFEVRNSPTLKGAYST